jgi:hypothetical protein
VLKESIQISDTITLIVRFKLQEAAKAEFVSRLKEVFAHNEREVTFKLDIVFANAGTGEFAQLGEISEEHCDSQMWRLWLSARTQSGWHCVLSISAN